MRRQFLPFAARSQGAPAYTCSPWYRLESAAGATGWHPVSAGLRQSADGVHSRRVQSYHEVTRTDQDQSFLLLDGPVGDGPRDLWVKQRNVQASQRQPGRSCGYCERSLATRGR